MNAREVRKLLLRQNALLSAQRSQAITNAATQQSVQDTPRLPGAVNGYDSIKVAAAK